MYKNLNKKIEHKFYTIGFKCESYWYTLQLPRREKKSIEIISLELYVFERNIMRIN